MLKKYIKIIDLVKEYNALKCHDSRHVDVNRLHKIESAVTANRYDYLVMEYYDSINVCSDICAQLDTIDAALQSTIRIKWTASDLDDEEEMTVDGFMAKVIGMLSSYENPKSEPSLQHLYDIVYANRYYELLLGDIDLKEAYHEALQARERLYKNVMKCVLF